MATTQTPGKRKRGRPSKKISQEKPIDELIVNAAREVCCEKGVHGLTVERILSKAGISRPTFYKFFKNKEEVIDLISKGVNQRLTNSITTVFNGLLPDERGFETAFEAAIDAYLKWGMEEGAIVGRLYQAMNDGRTIASVNREITVRTLISYFQSVLIGSGRQEKDPLLLEVMIHSVEYLCNPLFTNEHSDEYYHRIRNLVIDSMKKLILTND